MASDMRLFINFSFKKAKNSLFSGLKANFFLISPKKAGF